MLNTSEAKVLLQTITPAMAANWLKNNVHNRRPAQSTIEEYARAMQEGRWRLNGETVKISSLGRLMDGQHRLMACVKADCAFKSWVVLGVDDDTFDTVDIGRKRTAGDILGIDHCKNAVAVAAAIRWISLFRSGFFNMANIKMPADEVRLFLAAEPGVEHSVASALSASKILAPGLCGSLHYLFAAKDREAADLFFTDLATGSNLVPGDPVLVLREKLMRDRMSKSKLAQNEIASICIRAWNHRRQRNTGTAILKGATLGPDGKRSFPAIL
ncbi:hypothetical protein IVB43_23785 [Bradyrhizobium sp. 48]|uniref:hypothetical protein n=1 Tax=Bradyrhizobium sp. 48 TaxID=2782676 RepID=UPI001FF8E5D9|nr:hypothetical protein [Bradyrhizobium sp. 48]MCK1445410.1 hypothetical protein [Bradyrhizobium sp. 48]